MADGERQRRFEELLLEHRKIIFKVASIYARGAENRNDLAQEIRVQLWRSFGSYNADRAKFSTWMYRVALNVAISQARRGRLVPTDRIDSLNEDHLETVAGDEPSIEQDEHLSELYAFVGQLDEVNRALIMLYLEDRSYAEIAEILGISETNVSTKINRIKQKLRDQMSKRPQENKHGTG